MKKTRTVAKGRRRHSAAKDLGARKAGVKGGAVRASIVTLPYIEQDNSVVGRSGRIGSVAVDPSDPS